MVNRKVTLPKSFLTTLKCPKGRKKGIGAKKGQMKHFFSFFFLGRLFKLGLGRIPSAMENYTNSIVYTPRLEESQPRV